jgi:hypothetical protein
VPPKPRLGSAYQNGGLANVEKLVRYYARGVWRLADSKPSRDLRLRGGQLDKSRQEHIVCERVDGITWQQQRRKRPSVGLELDAGHALSGRT